MEEAQVIQAVQRMQEYIETNLHRKITLKELANVAGYSPWHAARLFKEVTGKPPFDYIRALRLTQAALLLRDEEVKIIDVAMDFVFDSHEGFTRAFSGSLVWPPANMVVRRRRSNYLCLRKFSIPTSRCIKERIE